MSREIKAEVQIFFLILLGAVALVLVPIILGLGTRLNTATAQEPKDPPVYPSHFKAETLAAFGLSLEDIQVAETIDLAVEMTPNSVVVLNGNTVQFDITIINNGPDPATYILFYDNFPMQMSNVAYQFSIGGVVSDNLPKPTWLIPGPIGVGAGNAVQVTVTGTVVSICDAAAPNTVMAYPFNTTAEPPNDPNNTDTSSLIITGDSRCNHLPLVIKLPAPTAVPVIFSDDFSSKNSGWPEFNSGGCDVEYKDNRYRVDANEDSDCFAFAPSAAEQRYAIFEVEARRGNSGGDEFAYGIYINGQGGDQYYLFEVLPEDGCGWKLVRRKSNNSSTVRSGGCSSAIKRNDGSNILKIKHESSGLITVYVNNTELATYQDNSQLTSTGTGIYVESDNNTDVEVNFDNFIVSRL